MTSGRSRTKDEIIEIMTRLGFELIDYYIGKHHKTMVSFQDCNDYKYNVRLDTLINSGQGIDEVDKCNPFSLENINVWLKINKKNFVLDVENSVYKDCYSPLNFICLNPNCQERFITYWNQIQVQSRDYICPHCSLRKKESQIATDLKNYFINNYNAITEYKICKNPMTGYYLPYDIYIPKDIFIEVHGPQHYEFVIYWHIDKDGFSYQKYKDKVKKDFAKQNGLYIEVDIRKVETLDKTIKSIIRKIDKFKKSKL